MSESTKRPIEIDDLFRLTLVGDAQISPSGTRVAYVVKSLDREADEYRSNIWLWEDGASRQYTAGGKDSAPRWSPDGSYLAFLSGREDKAQLYLISSAGGEARRLTDRTMGAGTPVWSPDGRSIAFTAPVPFPDEPEEEQEGEKKRARTHIIDRARFKLNGPGLIDDRRTHLLAVDVESGNTTQLTSGDWNVRSPAWSPDSRHLAFGGDRDPEWDLRAFSDIWLVPRDGGEPRRVTNGDGLWEGPEFSPDGSEIAFVGFARPKAPDCTHFMQLWTVPRSGGPARNLLEGIDLAVGDAVSGDWSAAGEDRLRWLPDGIYFLVSDRGTSNVRCWQDSLQDVTAGSRRVMDFSIAGGHMAFTTSDATQPPAIAMRDLRNGEERVITCHNREIMQFIRPVEPRKITFKGVEDVEVDGWLMRPAGHQDGLRYPLIVYIHGGPYGAYGETFFHEFQVLAAQGFGVFYCNPHGGASYGQRFQVSIRGNWGSADYADMMAGVDRAVQEPWVDSHRVGVAGGSYGGFLVNWLLGHTDRFAAAVTERGICNHVSQGGTSDWAAVRGDALGGTPEGNPDYLWDRSPLKYVRNVRTPTLIIHSERDDRCPIEEGEQWFMALKRLRVPTRFIRFPEETHELSRNGLPSRRVERLEHITRWFKTYL